MHTKRIDWTREEVKCLSDKWRSDDEELGDQIVKDLHRTGIKDFLCSGPTGTINQAKLKRVLVGYARWNPEVGYCQVSDYIIFNYFIRLLNYRIYVNNNSIDYYNILGLGYGHYAL